MTSAGAISIQAPEPWRPGLGTLSSSRGALSPGVRRVGNG